MLTYTTIGAKANTHNGYTCTRKVKITENYKGKRERERREGRRKEEKGRDGEKQTDEREEMEQEKEKRLTCSAALGSLLSIARPVSLSLVARAAANGVLPRLSFTDRSSLGCCNRI